jgi:uncharacterized protein YqjF (DUF2071 family)
MNHDAAYGPPSDVVSDEERLRVRSRPRDVPLMRQRWERLGFLHWAADPVAVARLLPPTLEVDTWEGAAFVGLVPFTIKGTRPPLLPPVPGLSSFHELNFRTYVHRRGRDPGVWFFSLDAASRAAVALARLVYKLPYYEARIALVEQPGGVVTFHSRRAGTEPATFGCSYGPTSDPPEAARAATLPFFLLERYLLYSWDGSRLRSARVWHRPYAIQAARVADLEEDLTERAGLSVAGRAPMGHYCHALDVRIYPPRLVAEPSRLRARLSTQLQAAQT